MTVYRDPSCGCCEAWAKIAEDAGYQVTLLDDNNMTAVKQRLGVPAELASCHTAVVGDYVIEGHVPLEEVDRLLRERPSDIAGIAVRSEEHTSELQSLMRISYAVLCL